MICAGAVSTEPKMNAAASTGSLVQPKPVEIPITLPASPVRAQDAELSLQNCGAVPAQSMIRKSVQRFSEKIMLKQLE
jgi:hypothetical protein